MSYEVVFCIVNAGFSDIVMDAAKEVGARGGTVIHARGTANKEAEQFFHITIQPDKEIVMILVPSEIKDDVLHALYRNAGLKTDGQGIAFSMAVDEVVGISGSAPAVGEQTEEQAEEHPENEAIDETVGEKAGKDE
ncbi:MAG: P-II family nitrogen regulator [Roseburia sp.]|nr:P-II family nitrogen regulator [Roseburia sp.]